MAGEVLMAVGAALAFAVLVAMCWLDHRTAGSRRRPRWTGWHPGSGRSVFRPAEPGQTPGQVEPDDAPAQDPDAGDSGPLVSFGRRAVHRECLAARRDGRPPCGTCAPVLVGRADSPQWRS